MGLRNVELKCCRDPKFTGFPKHQLHITVVST